jgi:hypothetical protein
MAYRNGLWIVPALMLAACGGAAENKAEPTGDAAAYESNAALADAMANEAEATAEHLENQADALREAGEEAAENASGNAAGNAL